MPVETRYFNHTSEIPLCFELSQNARALYLTRLELVQSLNVTGSFIDGTIGECGIRVWLSNGVEVTPGSPVAVVTRDVVGESGMQSATWNCPEKELPPGPPPYPQYILVSIYMRVRTPGFEENPWQFKRCFSTDYVGPNPISGKLDAATWTVYYWTWLEDTGWGFLRMWFRYDTAINNSRIENFSWTPVPPAVALKRLLVGVGL